MTDCNAVASNKPLKEHTYSSRFSIQLNCTQKISLLCTILLSEPSETPPFQLGDPYSSLVIDILDQYMYTTTEVDFHFLLFLIEKIESYQELFSWTFSKPKTLDLRATHFW